MNTTLSRRCVLITLSISMPSKAKKDREVTDRTLNAENAQKDAGRWVANLYPPQAFEMVQRCATKIREIVARNTLPWRDDGSRILPCASMLSIAEVLGEEKSKFFDHAQESASHFDEWLRIAQEVRGHMFKRSDYPDDSDEFLRGFAVTIDYLPLPDASHVVMDMAEDEIIMVRESTDKAIRAAGDRAAQDLKDRLAAPLRAMVDTLKVPDKIFRDSLVQNVSEIVKLFPALNITLDPVLSDVASDMHDLVKSTSAQQLRTNRTARQDAVERAERILAKVVEPVVMQQ